MADPLCIEDSETASERSRQLDALKDVLGAPLSEGRESRLPRSSAVETRLGQALRARGHAPVAQRRVGPFVLDWALTKGTGNTQTRLDIEVDGPVCHCHRARRRAQTADRR